MRLSGLPATTCRHRDARSVKPATSRSCSATMRAEHAISGRDPRERSSDERRRHEADRRSSRASPSIFQRRKKRHRGCLAMANPPGHPPPDRQRPKNTQQITRAMKMVAAAKLRRAQETRSRPRGPTPRRWSGDGSCRGPARRRAPAADPAGTRSGARGRSSSSSSDRGLCGAFNEPTIKARQALIDASIRRPDSIECLTAVGRKATEYLRRRRLEDRFARP